MASVARTRYGYRALVQLYIANGGSRKYAPIMAAIALAESAGKVRATHTNADNSVDQGLWQINSSNSRLYRGKNIFDPNVNASVAVELAEHSGSGLRNWVTYQTGAFRKYLPKMPKTLKAKPKNFGILTADNYAGTDQGVDFKGAGAIPALGSGVVTDVGKVHIIEGGAWPYVVYRLNSGPYKGHFVYVMENFVPTVKKGSRVVLGQTIGRSPGKFPYIEIGFNRTATGLNPVAPLGPNAHAATPAGSTMWNYIQGLAGLKRGGGGITGALGGAADAAGSAAETAAGVFTDPLGAAGSLFGKGASAAGNAIAQPLEEIAMKMLDAFAIAGGGFVFIFGFALVAADIGLSSKAGRAVAAVPAGRFIARAASPSSRRAASSAPATPSRAEERREEIHQARLQESQERTKKHRAQATESRTRQKNRRRTKAEQEKAEKRAYIHGARDVADPTMTRIRKQRQKRNG